MAIQCKTTVITAPGAIGSQAYTGIGFRPQAILVYTSGQTSTGASDSSYNFGYGMYDGTTQGCVGIYGSDGDSHDALPSTMQSDKLLYLVQIGVNASATSLDADGFTINWLSTYPSLRIYVTAFAGFDNAKVKRLVGPTATGTKAYTGFGFKPDSLITIGANNANTPTDYSADADSMLGIGMCDSSLNQSGVGIGCAYGYDSSTYGLMYPSSMWAIPSCSGAAINERMTVTSLDSDGFTLNVNTLTTSSAYLWTLALKGGSCNGHTLTQPNATTGAQSVTGKTFTPTGMFAISYSAVASSSATSNAKIMLGSASSSSSRGTVMHYQANATTSDISEHNSGSLVLAHVNTTPTVVASADFTSFNSDGYTVNWSAADATQRSHFVMLWGDAASAARTSRLSLLGAG